MVKSTQTQNSRYSQGGTTVDLGNRLGWWERTIFPKSPLDSTFVITRKYAKRPDKLAFDLYGQSTLGWFVMQYNDLCDVSTEFVEGKTILLPARSRVFNELLGKKN